MTTPTTDSIDVAAVEAWLSRFAEALRSRGDGRSLEDVLLPDALWRDGLAVSWQLTTLYGLEQITEALQAAPLSVQTLALDPTLEMRRTVRNGVEHIEVPYSFTTSIGRGRGYVRLVERDGQLWGWTFGTILDELIGHEERTGANRPSGLEFSRTFSGPNWLDKRNAEQQFDGREPEVLIAGGGQAGLTVAARLRQLGVDSVIVDPMERAGDNWRNRYHSLTLHNEADVCHLPYMPFPDTWPTYIPKDMLAGWLENYATAMELNFWGSTRLVKADYDETAQTWTATVRHHDGTERVVRPKHIILATGVSGKPIIPNLPGSADFTGTKIHTSAFEAGASYQGKRVLVVGTGTSGHDTAQELHGAGAEVTMMQRSATAITTVGIERAGKLYASYMRGRPTEETDLKSASTPYPLNRHSMQLLTRELREAERELHDGLEAAGFRVTFGEDDLGFAGKFFESFGHYYLDVGCSGLIADGAIKVIQFADFDRFVADGVQLQTGETLEFDHVVFATGFQGQNSIAGEIFGEDVQRSLGRIWGFDPQGEMNNMWRRTEQKGLWIAGGGFAQCRINSKFLALQIKGRLAGLVPDTADSTEPLGRVRPQDVVDVEEFSISAAPQSLESGVRV
ncbi:NAD(P)/FAD-dependent oxidoreductase [Rhodococcus sp. IEGM 1307]|uniref:flavin-containing monooxygenase n=1 Tax=Rhodococcus sp. IEGM 1307 TaxID=3047091 RepID=UPI0024B68A16|nr:NAD(P)/FAD-dependent oxidoreductase [Rhodococcus sp. IEGM 1307]MDI9979405.1 NAD(P)/FAD-dependent oxidoreductase [Rhodococcus sp. IEGM 1307]